MKKNVPSKIELVIPPLWATTDNAAMIAKAAVAYINKGLICNLEMGVDPNWELEDCTKNNK